MADFETTTLEFRTEETKVWLAYSENIWDEFDNYLSLSLGDWWFNAIESLQETATIFFHNLNWDGEFMMNWLADNRLYVKPKERQLKTSLVIGEWTNMSDGVSSHYQIVYRNLNNKLIYIRDSYKLLRASVSTLSNVDFKEKINYHIKELYEKIEDVPEKVIFYIKNDVKKVIPHLRNFIKHMEKDLSLTSAGSAFKRLRNMSDKKKFDVYFKNKIKPGSIDEKGYHIPGEWDYFKQGYIGAFCYLRKGIEHKLISAPPGFRVYRWDKNSLYPYIMWKFPLPVGFPLYGCKCKGKQHQYIFYEVKISAKIKPGNIPIIPSGNIQFIDKIVWEEEVENQTQFVTSQMLDYWKEVYDISKLEVIKEIHFMTRENIFNEFFEKYQDLKTKAKLEGDLAMYMLSKNLQNSVYGKPGMDYLRKTMYLRPFDETKDYRKDKVIYGKRNKLVFDYEWKVTPPLYIPLAIWITSLAKIETHRLVNLVNTCNHHPDAGFLYSDTDSVHALLCDACYQRIVSLTDIHPTRTGAWDEEGDSKYFYGFGRKRYLEFDILDGFERNIGFAGVDKELLLVYTNREIINGYDRFGKKVKFIKKMKRKITGGVVLEEKEVQLKNETVSNKSH